MIGSSREPGLRGAAIIAWTGLSRFASLAAAQDALVGTARRSEQALWDAGCADFCR